MIGLDQPLGLLVSSDPVGLFSRTQADVVLHSTGSYLEQVRPQLVEIVEAGLNVVSTCKELAYPQAQHPALAEELDALAKKHSVTVLGTGVNPGFAQDTIAIAVSGVCQDVKHITVTRIVEVGERRLPLQKKVGAGLTVAEFEEKAKKREIRHVGLEESLTMLAHALGWQLDKVEETIEPVIAEKPIKSQFVEVKPGQVSGVHQVARGIKGGQELIVLHLYMYIGAEHPGDSVVIEGTPDIELTIKGIHGDFHGGHGRQRCAQSRQRPAGPGDNERPAADLSLAGRLATTANSERGWQHRLPSPFAGFSVFGLEGRPYWGHIKWIP